LDLNNNLEKIFDYKSHDFEAWTCCFDVHSDSILYTGGDDSILNLLDIKENKKIASIKNTHQAGVTSLLSHPLKEHYFLSGSYDEYIRTWDNRSLKKPLFEKFIGGGVWRMKLDLKNGRLFTCNMMEGFNVLELDDNLQINRQFNYKGGHESIAYGIDFERNQNRFCSASFYDNHFEYVKFEFEN
jgi:diphthine methyl ester acylhydrolase